MFIYRTIDRFSQTATLDDRKRSGDPRVVRTNAAIKTVSKRITKNLLQKQKIMSKQMNISSRSLSILIGDDLHNKAGQLVTF